MDRNPELSTADKTAIKPQPSVDLIGRIILPILIFTRIAAFDQIEYYNPLVFGQPQRIYGMASCRGGNDRISDEQPAGESCFIAQNFDQPRTRGRFPACALDDVDSHFRGSPCLVKRIPSAETTAISHRSIRRSVFVSLSSTPTLAHTTLTVSYFQQTRSVLSPQNGVDDSIDATLRKCGSERCAWCSSADRSKSRTPTPGSPP